MVRVYCALRRAAGDGGRVSKDAFKDWVAMVSQRAEDQEDVLDPKEVKFACATL